MQLRKCVSLILSTSEASKIMKMVLSYRRKTKLYFYIQFISLDQLMQLFKGVRKKHLFLRGFVSPPLRHDYGHVNGSKKFETLLKCRRRFNLPEKNIWTWNKCFPFWQEFYMAMDYRDVHFLIKIILEIFNKRQDQVFGNILKFVSENIFLKQIFLIQRFMLCRTTADPRAHYVCVFSSRRGITSVCFCCWCCSAHCTNEWMDVNFMSGSFSHLYPLCPSFLQFFCLCVVFHQVSACAIGIESVYARNVSYTSSVDFL